MAYDCVCIHESYLKDWIFQDYDVLDYSESESEEISDSERVLHARARMKGLIEDSYEAPVMFFIDLLRSGVRQASTIIGWYSAGQGGWYYELAACFTQGDYEAELANTGFVSLDDL